MGSIGPTEIIVVMIIALLILGPKRLPEAGKSLGKGLKEFKDSISGATHADTYDPALDEPKPVSVPEAKVVHEQPATPVAS